MSKESPELVEKAVETEQAAAEELVLRDESDEIIDTLKSQLKSLKTQLDAYKTADSGGPGPPQPAGGEQEELMKAWNAGLAPHLATRLQMPTEELTARLDRLIEQADEPELRQELERCRDLAYFLFETFRKISSSHRLLTESLTAPKEKVEMAEFGRMLERALPPTAAAPKVRLAPELPEHIVFTSRSANTIMKALAELAMTLFGKELHIDVGLIPPGEKGPGEPGYLRFRLAGETSWADPAREQGREQEVAAFAMKRGITANTVVDLLYVEKIIELQGGDFSFHREKGRVHGFELFLPFDSVTD